MPRQNKVLLAGVVNVILLVLVPLWQRNGHSAGSRPIFVPQRPPASGSPLRSVNNTKALPSTSRQWCPKVMCLE